MGPSLLVLGGSSFVGRALVSAGVARGWEVTTFNRGRGGWADPRVERLIVTGAIRRRWRRWRAGLGSAGRHVVGRPARGP